MFRKYFTALIFGMGILTLFGSSDVMAVSCKKPGTNTTILCEGCSPVPNAQTACSCPSDKRTKCSHDGGAGFACASSQAACPGGTNCYSW